VSHAPPPLTLHRRIGAGAVLRRGTASAYRLLRAVDGEPHALRPELGGAGGPAVPRAGARPLLTLAHVTDLQLADVQSPARFEFFNREAGDPRFARLVPVQRPQEALAPHAAEAMVATLNRVAGGPVGGAPLQLVVTTGDAIDNAQWNELRMFLALMDGGLVRPGSGSGGYQGVQSPAWPDDIFWRPDPSPGPPDVFRTAHGFGDHPGLLERALAEFATAGLAVPWLACYGNHEALVQGVGVVTPAVAAAMVGGRKPSRLPAHTDRDTALELFTVACDAFLGGDDVAVAADADRRPVTRREFVEAHLAAGGRPAGHGFTERNAREGTASYTHDLPGVRLVALDTTCAAGAADGALDAAELAWLEAVLAEVHASHRAAGGSWVRTGNDDRLVVLFSHHGLDTLTNARGAELGADGQPVAGARRVEALLHRFPNVVLWLTGHTHTNAVRSRPAPDPDRPGGGFWEVTTCAVMDWPGQARLVELLDPGDGLLRIACTMVDHDSPVVPDRGPFAGPAAAGREHLAGLHRELSANVPLAGLGSPTAGTAGDRNVVLTLPAPSTWPAWPGERLRCGARLPTGGVTTGVRPPSDEAGRRSTSRCGPPPGARTAVRVALCPTRPAVKVSLSPVRASRAISRRSCARRSGGCRPRRRPATSPPSTPCWTTGCSRR
jgi:metallophosphoesterase (TIGR03767 family)